MRRIRTGRAGAIAAAVAVAVPAVIAGTAGTAAADAGSLTVTTLNREGAKVTSWMTVTSLTPHAGDGVHEYQSGWPVTLAPGQYAVVTRIDDNGLNAQDGPSTLAAQIVTVADSAPTALTLDARQGKPLRVALDTPPGASYVQSIAARMCVAGVNDDFETTTGTRPTGGVYVIPTDDPQTRLGYHATWSSATQKEVWDVSGAIAPTGDPITVPRASLGTVDVKASTGPSSLNTQTAPLESDTQGTGCDQKLGTPNSFTKLPFEKVLHVSPGSWKFTLDTWHYDTTVAAGATTALDFGRAVWGPTRYLPFVQKGELGFFTSGLVADPKAAGADITINATATLYRDGKAVVTRTGLGNSPSAKGPSTFWAPISTSAAYTLKVHGYRHAAGVPQPAGMMSTGTDVAFSFHAGPTSDAVPPAFLTRFLPNGLDPYNHLPAGHAASIPLTLDRTSTQAGVPMWPSTAKKVEVFGSTDGGRSWHALTVSHTGGGWTAALPAQHAGAELSLSARVTDVGGNQTVTSVYRAFTVA
ncbi:hypothetical protein V2S66_25595 [Streptomyces sp. V4-01]|uniref:Uncharacterized protein n=1 Tax=Actinacidiphila polyblastidii TaxID=3110430 RepID=A0ABU7PHM9_9ACTN|nr:hypothetical protein [Streptomyces sp. V4-01]